MRFTTSNDTHGVTHAGLEHKTSLNTQFQIKHRLVFKVGNEISYKIQTTYLELPIEFKNPSRNSTPLAYTFAFEIQSRSVHKRDTNEW